MYTGIITAIGTVEGIEKTQKDDSTPLWLYRIHHPWANDLPVLGESIGLSGCCTTVVAFDAQTFTVEIMAESRRVTTFGDLKPGDGVNLERSAVIGQRNSGYDVLGHIDQTAEVLEVVREKDYWKVAMAYAPEYEGLLVPKGWIVIDGVALTVGTVEAEKFSVYIIDHTWHHTTLQRLKKGKRVHLEYDRVAKYIAKQVALRG